MFNCILRGSMLLVNDNFPFGCVDCQTSEGRTTGSVKALLLTVIVFFLFFGIGAAFGGNAGIKDDLGAVYIEIRAIQRPLSEVLKSIEQKTDIQIKLSRKLNKKVTIELKHYPLLDGLERLLASTDHSVLYDAGKRKILITILGDGRRNARGLVANSRQNSVREGDGPPMEASAMAVAAYQQSHNMRPDKDALISSVSESPMEDSSRAVMQYQKGKDGSMGEEKKLTQGTGVSPMEASSVAVVDYKRLKIKQLVKDVQLKEKTSPSPMEASSLAVLNYTKLRQEQPAKIEQDSNRSPMEASSRAITEYKKYN